MQYSIQKWLTKFALLSMITLLTASCKNSAGELEELKEVQHIAQRNAQYAFKAGLGELIWVLPLNVKVVHISGDSFSLGSKTAASDFTALNNVLTQHYIYRNREKMQKTATGALAAFFYPLFDKLLDGDTDSQMYVSLIRIILVCKDALAKLVDKPDDYTPENLQAILDKCQKNMKEAPQLELLAAGKVGPNGEDAYTLQALDGALPENYYKAPGVEEAFEAFKKEVEKLQVDYEKVLGLKETA